MIILVSSCLLGLPARYNGQEVGNGAVLPLLRNHTLVPVCPEQLGGLPIPREPAEIRAGTVLTKSGADVTLAYRKGAEAALRVARMYGCTHAIFQKRSPSCGTRRIYDGTFRGILVEGNGIAAQLLIDAGITVVDEDAVATLFATEEK